MGVEHPIQAELYAKRFGCKSKSLAIGVVCELVIPVLQLRELQNHVQGAREQSIIVVESVLLCHLASKL